MDALLSEVRAAVDGSVEAAQSASALARRPGGVAYSELAAAARAAAAGLRAAEGRLRGARAALEGGSAFPGASGGSSSGAQRQLARWERRVRSARRDLAAAGGRAVLVMGDPDVRGGAVGGGARALRAAREMSDALRRSKDMVAQSLERAARLSGVLAEDRESLRRTGREHGAMDGQLVETQRRLKSIRRQEERDRALLYASVAWFHLVALYVVLKRLMVL